MTAETTETEKPFWQRPLPPIKRPGETAVLTDVPAIEVNELPPASAPAVNGGEAVAGEGSALPPAPRLAPNVVLANAVQALDEARYEARQRRDAVAAARENFNAALRDWNRTFPVQTVDDAKREVFRTNQAERARKAAQGRLRRPMTVTETARAMAGGNRRAGGGAAYKRNGTFTRAEAVKIEMNRAATNRLREAAAAATPRVKLPSEK